MGYAEVGGWMEIGGLALAPFTKGASLTVTTVGANISLGGTVINTGIDLIDGDYEMAIFRAIKQGVTFGTGKVIDRIYPGTAHGLDKSIWLINAKLWETVLTPYFNHKNREAC